MYNTTDIVNALSKLHDLIEEDTTQPICRAYLIADAAVKIEKMERALEAARLLCANLRNGGVGHMSLVENFDKLVNG